jgi:hypothetical protein
MCNVTVIWFTYNTGAHGVRLHNVYVDGFISVILNEVSIRPYTGLHSFLACIDTARCNVHLASRSPITYFGPYSRTNGLSPQFRPTGLPLVHPLARPMDVLTLEQLHVTMG